MGMDPNQIQKMAKSILSDRDDDGDEGSLDETGSTGIPVPEGHEIESIRFEKADGGAVSHTNFRPKPGHKSKDGSIGYHNSHTKVHKDHADAARHLHHIFKK